MTHQPDEDDQRAARRESIRHLLDRAGRGVLIGGTEGELLRHQVEAEFRLFEADVQRWLAFIERGMDTHMQFSVLRPDGTSEQLPCADWCHACRVEKAEAAITRVRALLDTHLGPLATAAVRRALEEPGLAATEATEPAQQADADTCRLVEVDGQTILMRGAGELTEQEQQFAAEILRAAKKKYAEEHAEPDAIQLRALAFNVIGPVLRAYGEHLPLSARRAVADAVLDVVLPGARITATLGRMSEADVQRVIDLYER
ncbi:hypothetical protein PYK79_50080 [Streptomyces sp. ID05-04B]|uniref:hypothetical protein n=1 Tax=Streptomyces sp. ID05-04B TaxID=3028661 RepID=UPI0029C3018A|nr:hypothetical protein [Streptomyces sp. ID05-04B]MDX5569830.1 hypothetical protein [Streptomyces sp. ID05-04B]